MNAENLVKHLEQARHAATIEELWSIAKDSKCGLEAADFSEDDLTFSEVQSTLVSWLNRDLDEAEAEEEKSAKDSAWNDFVEAAEAAMRSVGKIRNSKQAQTGTLYYTIEREAACGCSREITVRVANHGDCYCRADLSVVYGSPTPDDIGVEELASCLSKIKVECDDSHEEE